MVSRISRLLMLMVNCWLFSSPLPPLPCHTPICVQTYWAKTAPNASCFFLRYQSLFSGYYCSVGSLYVHVQEVFILYHRMLYHINFLVSYCCTSSNGWFYWTQITVHALALKIRHHHCAAWCGESLRRDCTLLCSQDTCGMSLCCMMGRVWGGIVHSFALKIHVVCHCAAWWGKFEEGSSCMPLRSR